MNVYGVGCESCGEFRTLALAGRVLCVGCLLRLTYGVTR